MSGRKGRRRRLDRDGRLLDVLRLALDLDAVRDALDEALDGLARRAAEVHLAVGKERVDLLE